jgi:hypothetical protein
MSYCIDIRDNTLVFATSSFRAEGRSVLHSGIYSRELASSLAAGGLLMLLGFFFAVRGKIHAAHFLTGAAAFAVLFLVFRGYVFREPLLQAVFDRGRAMVEILVRGPVITKKEMYEISGLSGIALESLTVEPRNPDGIKVVEKIALQHGMVIPGFGKTEEIHSVVLDFPGRPRTIFSTTKREDAERVIAEIGKFLSIKGAEIQSVGEKNFDTVML